MMIELGQGVSCTTPSPAYAWADIDDKEKIERLRERVRQLEEALRSEGYLSRRLDEMETRLRFLGNHSHAQDGTVKIKDDRYF